MLCFENRGRTKHKFLVPFYILCAIYETGLALWYEVVLLDLSIITKLIARFIDSLGLGVGCQTIKSDNQRV
jgi:hypothetical protein